ncbi:putative ORFan [Tupanvirus deep ocean]|uniref:ORFan n=2 Tax=Tupanvirus TaxID=2094720 RepID=A0AC62A7B5_9VIRU|nr:putative ORFan [Tupanvirus deep ocean]QKU33498.1 putative ORFan [Tupanvirus deep ocean]
MVKLIVYTSKNYKIVFKYLDNKNIEYKFQYGNYVNT